MDDVVLSNHIPLWLSRNSMGCHSRPIQYPFVRSLHGFVISSYCRKIVSKLYSHSNHVIFHLKFHFYSLSTPRRIVSSSKLTNLTLSIWLYDYIKKGWRMCYKKKQRKSDKWQCNKGWKVYYFNRSGTIKAFLSIISFPY